MRCKKTCTSTRKPSPASITLSMVVCSRRPPASGSALRSCESAWRKLVRPWLVALSSHNRATRLSRACARSGAIARYASNAAAFFAANSTGPSAVRASRPPSSRSSSSGSGIGRPRKNLAAISLHPHFHAVITPWATLRSRPAPSLRFETTALPASARRHNPKEPTNVPG